MRGAASMAWSDAEVYVSGGRKPTGLRVVEWAREAEQRGAGEILLTDGHGRDARRVRLRADAAVSEAVQIPVIASGGAGTAAHFAEVFKAGQGGCGAGGEHLSLWRDGLARVEGGGCGGGCGDEAAVLRTCNCEREGRNVKRNVRNEAGE